MNAFLSFGLVAMSASTALSTAACSSASFLGGWRENLRLEGKGCHFFPTCGLSPPFHSFIHSTPNPLGPNKQPWLLEAALDEVLDAAHARGEVRDAPVRVGVPRLDLRLE